METMIHKPLAKARATTINIFYMMSYMQSLSQSKTQQDQTNTFRLLTRRLVRFIYVSGWRLPLLLTTSVDHAQSLSCQTNGGSVSRDIHIKQISIHVNNLNLLVRFCWIIGSVKGTVRLYKLNHVVRVT